MGRYLAWTLVAVSTVSLMPRLMAQRYHYDYHDGHYDYHNGHYDYHEGHYDRHYDNHHHDGYVRPRSSYYTPRTEYRPPSTYGFAARSHTGALSADLRRQANSMCVEAHRHYRHNPGFAEIYRDMYQVKTDAEHLVALANSSHASVHGTDHIAADLNSIDQLFHHVQGGVREWTPDNAYHQTLPARMATVEQTIHHLMKDYGVKSKVAASSQQGSQPGYQPGSRQGSSQGSSQGSPQYSRQSPSQVPTRAGKSIVIQNDFGP